MARQTSKQMETLLARAAVLRSTGSTWAQVAEKLGRNPTRVRQWPREHRGVWDAAYADAHTNVVDEAVAEGIETLRHGMHNGNPDVQVRAAHSLLTYAAKRHPVDVNLTIVSGLADDLVQAIRQYVPEDQQEQAVEAIRECLG